MHQLELLGGVVGGLMREGPALQLGHHIGVLEVLDMVDAGHVADHLLLAELFQGLKVKMPEMLVPAPASSSWRVAR